MPTDSLPISPGRVQWCREGGKDVSQWRHLGTRHLEGHGDVEFRARLHRYGAPDGNRAIRPLVQYRTADMDDWGGNFQMRSFQRVVSMVHGVLDTAARVVPE